MPVRHRTRADSGSPLWLRNRLAAALLVVAGALLPAAAPRAQTTLTIAHGIDPQVLDPANDTLVSTRSIMSNLYDGLLWRDTKGQILPALAESWTFIDDKTLQLNLRRGAKFHNGDTVTADDVVWSANRYTDRQNPVDLGAYLRDLWKSIEKKDDYTVVIHLPAPSATILADLNRMPILPEKAFKAIGERAFGNRPIGTGPFRFRNWDRNEQLVFEAFPEHWRGRPSVDRLIFKPIPEDFARFAALKTGAVDLIANFPPERIGEIKRDPNLKIVSIPSSRSVHIGINLLMKPFDDVRVRQALNYAVNVQEIIDTVLDGQGYVNPAFCQKQLFGHDPSVKPYGYNPEKAKQLLAAAGYPNGFETQLLGPTGRYMKDREVQEAVAGQLAKVGIKITMVTPEWGEFLDRLYGRGKYKDPFPGLYMLGTGGETLDCDRTLLQRAYTKSRLPYWRTANSDKIDAMFFEQKQILDPAKRLEKFKEIEALIQQDVPWIFLYDQQDVYAMKKTVEWTPRPDEFLWAFDMKVIK